MEVSLSSSDFVAEHSRRRLLGKKRLRLRPLATAPKGVAPNMQQQQQHSHQPQQEQSFGQEVLEYEIVPMMGITTNFDNYTQDETNQRKYVADARFERNYATGLAVGLALWVTYLLLPRGWRVRYFRAYPKQYSRSKTRSFSLAGSGGSSVTGGTLSFASGNAASAGGISYAPHHRRKQAVTPDDVFLKRPYQPQHQHSYPSQHGQEEPYNRSAYQSSNHHRAPTHHNDDESEFLIHPPASSVGATESSFAPISSDVAIRPPTPPKPSHQRVSPHRPASANQQHVMETDAQYGGRPPSRTVASSPSHSVGSSHGNSSSSSSVRGEEVVVSTTMQSLRSVGVRLVAHGVQCQPKHVWLRLGPKALLWQAERAGGGKGQVRTISLLDILHVDVGKQTTALRRNTGLVDQIQDEHCFSLLTKSGSLDLQASSQIQRDSLVTCFTIVLEQLHQLQRQEKQVYDNSEDDTASSLLASDAVEI